MIKYNAPKNKKEYEKIRKNWNKTYNNPNRPYKKINATDIENEYYKPKKNKGTGCIIALLIVILLILLIPYIFTAGLLGALAEINRVGANL